MEEGGEEGKGGEGKGGGEEGGESESIIAIRVENFDFLNPSNPSQLWQSESKI